MNKSVDSEQIDSYNELEQNCDRRSKRSCNPRTEKEE